MRARPGTQATNDSPLDQSVSRELRIVVEWVTDTYGTTGRLPRLIFRPLRLRLLEPGNLEGDIVGLYTDTAGVNHAFLLSHGVFTSFDFPGAHLP
jgi:hypothetical protein